MGKHLIVFFLFLITSIAHASVDGSISGTVEDDKGISRSGVQIKVISSSGQTIKQTTSSATGTFEFFPVDFGDYTLRAEAPDFQSWEQSVHVAAGVNSSVQVKLAAGTFSKEMVLHVSAKKRVQDPAPTSSVEITKEKIAQLPQGEAISLPKLITTTTPGVVQGPFGQMFIRGNHANIQYQIDGVQLPDSSSGTFGEAFSPRNIDHMELITGGIPAEYGQRLAAVMNIITKTGPQTSGGSAEINYGSYNTFSPQATYGGSNESGNLHYFFSGKYGRTDRGLDTPQPASNTDLNSITKGGSDAVHDSSNSNNEFAKVDWVLDNENKFTFVGFHAYSFYQIPNYPSSFGPTSPFFTQTDIFGNDPYNWVPSTTNDTQSERNAYLQAVWKHTFSDRSFLQVAPYWKFSSVTVTNDRLNDLQGTSSPTSFAEDRQANNFGLKTDYTLRLNEKHLIKTGFQVQASTASGPVSIETPTPPVFTDNSTDTGYLEGVYIQDDFTIIKSVILNAGLRFDATQFHFSDLNTSDSALQPRIGLTFLPTETTKLHIFYGRLFQPAPIENLRLAFSNVPGAGTPGPYDIKAEKDNYFEVGVAQAVPGDQVVTVNAYYKDATNMLDDVQLLNTSIASPYNFATGYAYGVEASVTGQITEDLTDYINYSWEIAKGKGISGGIFAFAPGQQPSNDYQFLDHVQIHTVNAGLTYNWRSFWFTGQGLFGSGLRTDPNNASSLPSHLTFDLSVGYNFKKLGPSWWNDLKLSLDVLNITDNAYPITIANGFNGSHYSAGRTFYLHLIKEL